MNKPVEDRAVIDGQEAVWAVGYAVRSTLSENAKHIRETRKSLREDKMPGVIRPSRADRRFSTEDEDF